MSFCGSLALGPLNFVCVRMVSTGCGWHFAKAVAVMQVADPYLSCGRLASTECDPQLSLEEC